MKAALILMKSLAPCFVLLLLSMHASLAALPEPDNILYGAITLDGQAVEADRTDIVIEARRSASGPPIARYRMGEDPRLGNLYALKIPVEALPPIADPAAAQEGETLFIVLADAFDLRAQTTYTVGARGAVERVDFGAAVADTDGDGLPDAWELHHFGNLNQTGGATAPNGLTVLDTFIQGVTPEETNLFGVTIIVDNATQRVSFFARRAEGAGYEGVTRFYALETSQTLTPGSWAEVPEFSHLAGDNETHTFQAAPTNAPAFYRAVTWLEGL